MPEENKTKCRVVVDTNVFVSGLTFKGKPREVLDLAWQGEIHVYISSFILKELEDALREDFGWSREEIRYTIGKVKAKTTLINPKTTISVIKTKEDDNRILECAVEAEVQYLITGDKNHLLPLEKYQGIKILSPADFLRLV
jgi:uncharacterized protein